MLKKNAEVKWDKEAREYFSRIKEALQEAPILIRPTYHIISFHNISSSREWIIRVIKQDIGQDP